MQVSTPSVVLAAVTGSALGTAWDRMHVVAGALTYTGTGHPQPWWVPVEFGVAGIAVLLGVRTFGDPIPDAKAPRRALGEAVWFSGLYAVSALLWEQPAIVVALLLVALAARASAIGRTGVANPLPAVALVVGGPLMEMLVSSAGLFEYARPDFAAIPLWLPVLYMNAVPLIVRGTEAMLWITRPASKP